MIYCITPSKADFIRFKEHKYPGRDDVKWIESLDQLRGLPLFKGDHFDFPPVYHRFDEAMRNMFEDEIRIMHLQQKPYERTRKIAGAEHMATLPDGYEWLFMKYQNGFGLIGAHPDKPVIGE